VNREGFLRTLFYSYRVGKLQLVRLGSVTVVCAHNSSHSPQVPIPCYTTSSYFTRDGVMLVNSTAVPRTLLDPHLHLWFHVGSQASLLVRPILTTNVDQFLQLTGAPQPFSCS
jgi:hypothetical protein